MKKILSKAFACVLLVNLLTGCVSTYRPNGKNALLQGMLYDFDNSPVSGYCVQIDSKQKTFTDINGRFSFSDIPYGIHTIHGFGDKHISFKQNYTFSDKTEVLHVRIPSFDTVYVLIDRALTSGNGPEARRLLEQLPKEEKATLAWRLYSSLALYREASPEDKDCWLEQAERLALYIKGHNE